MEKADGSFYGWGFQIEEIMKKKNLKVIYKSIRTLA